MCTALVEAGRAREATVLLALLERQAITADLLIRQLLLDARVCFVAGAARPETAARLLDDRGLRATFSSATEARARAIASAASARAADDLQLADAADELAAWMLAQHAQHAAPLRRRAPVTLALILANVAVFATVLGLGLGDDDLGLARAGGLFRPAVLAGEWWRLVSATFLHADVFHLGVNMYGLFLLGRLTEDLLGGARLFVVYACAGLGGGLASMWADRGLSVGASGSLMGLLGALIVIALARRQVVQRAAHRAFLGGLLLMVVLQVFIGLEVPMIDGAAHAGGFVAGAVATLGLAPGRALRVRALVPVAVAMAVAFAAAGALAATRPLQRTLLSLPMAVREVHGVSLTVPRSWRADDHGVLVDPHLGVELTVTREGDAITLASPSSSDPRVRPLLGLIAGSAHPASQTP
jgi:membrane associated rhomboid family serine protease